MLDIRKVYYPKMLALDLVDTVNKKGTALDLINVCSSIGVEIVNSNFKQYKEKIAGKISRENGSIKIFVNQDDTIENQRFNIAKMIGWFLLNMSKLDKNEKIFLNTNKFEDKENCEINDFATELLVDEKLLKGYIKAALPTEFDNFLKNKNDKYVSSNNGTYIKSATIYPREYIIDNLAKMFEVDKDVIEYKLSIMN
jgi:Zn-dependent peptidase ImmA (M78 family)